MYYGQVVQHDIDMHMQEVYYSIRYMKNGYTLVINGLKTKIKSTI